MLFFFCLAVQQKAASDGTKTIRGSFFLNIKIKNNDNSAAFYYVRLATFSELKFNSIFLEVLFFIQPSHFDFYSILPPSLQ